MIECDPRVNALACKPRKIWQNGDGLASMDAVKGLPVAGDVVRLFKGKRLKESPRDYPTVLVSVRALPLTECLVDDGCIPEWPAPKPNGAMVIYL